MSHFCNDSLQNSLQFCRKTPRFVTFVIWSEKSAIIPTKNELNFGYRTLFLSNLSG